VRFPKSRGVALGVLLRDLLAQVTLENNPDIAVTSVVKGGAVVIVPSPSAMVTPVQAPTPDDLLPSPNQRVLGEPVHVTAAERPIGDVLRELAEATGANLVLDARQRDKLQLPVTVNLQDVPLDTAVELLADMADLKAVAIDTVLYVTTKENAARIQKERRPAPQMAKPAAGA